jgi:hypothetical protein
VIKKRRCIMTPEKILEEIKKLPLKQQAKVIKEVEKYKLEVIEELDAEPVEKLKPRKFTWPEIVKEKEYIPYPVYPPYYVRPYRPYWDDWRITYGTTTGDVVETINISDGKIGSLTFDGIIE